MTSAAWFDGPALRRPEQVELVEALGEAAAAGSFPGVAPADTSRALLPTGYRGGVVVALVVPGLTCGRRVLRVSYEVGDATIPSVLRSDWAADLDAAHPPGEYEGPTEDTDLWVSGILASPRTSAGWVTDWFVRQLARPVLRREWDQPATGPGSGLWGRARRAAAVEWYLTQPEQLLDSRGTFGRWRLIRQPPSRELRERP